MTDNRVHFDGADGDKPADVWKDLPKTGELMLPSNGHPIAALSTVSEEAHQGEVGIVIGGHYYGITEYDNATE